VYRWVASHSWNARSGSFVARLRVGWTTALWTNAGTSSGSTAHRFSAAGPGRLDVHRASFFRIALRVFRLVPRLVAGAGFGPSRSSSAFRSPASGPSTSFSIAMARRMSPIALAVTRAPAGGTPAVSWFGCSFGQASSTFRVAARSASLRRVSNCVRSEGDQCGHRSRFS